MLLTGMVVTRDKLDLGLKHSFTMLTFGSQLLTSYGIFLGALWVIFARTIKDLSRPVEEE